MFLSSSVCRSRQGSATMGAASSRLEIFDKIEDPEGLLQVYAPAAAAAAPENGAPLQAAPTGLAARGRTRPAGRVARIQAGAIILAQVYGVDDHGLEDDPAEIRDMQVGPERLVVNISQLGRDLVGEISQFLDQLDVEDELLQPLYGKLIQDEIEEEYLKLQHEVDVEGADPKDVKNMLQHVAGTPGGAYTMASALIEAPLPGKTKVVSVLQPITHQDAQDECAAVKKRRLALHEDTAETSSTARASSSNSSVYESGTVYRP